MQRSSDPGAKAKDRAGRGHSRWKVLFAAVFALYLSGGVAFGYVFVKQVESFFAIDLLSGAPSLLSVIPPDLGASLGAKLGISPPAPPPLPENERVTVLLLGVDQREVQRRRGEPARTDTMMLATIEPSTRTAALLSIPRDLWVTIPPAGESGSASQMVDRINTAHFWGEAHKHPGGGPALAKRAVEYNFGVTVHYFARIDFHGFEKAIDTFGGITIDVPKPIYDEEYPDDEDGIITISFRPGRQLMNGVRALQYVRTRHGDNDFGRAERQRQALMALREKALALDALPRLPALMSILGDSFQTDMSPAEILRLGNIARSIDPSQIQMRAVDLTMATPIVTSGGADVLLPNRKAIARLMGEMFFDPHLTQEGATLEILNGTPRTGLASGVADALTARGFAVTRVDNADRNDYPETLVKHAADKSYTIHALSALLQVSPGNVSAATPTENGAEVTIILGRDAQVPAP